MLQLSIQVWIKQRLLQICYEALDHKRKFYFMMLLNSNWLYYCRQLKSKIFFKNNDSFHLGAAPKHFSFNCINSNFPPFLWPLICSYWVWLTNELVNKQYLVWFCSNQMFLRSRVVSKHLEEGSLPQMFKNPSPRQKMCLNQKNISHMKTSNSNQSFEFIFKINFGSFLCSNIIQYSHYVTDSTNQHCQLSCGSSLLAEFP